MKKCLNEGCNSYSTKPDNNCLSRSNISGCPDSGVDASERGYSAYTKGGVSNANHSSYIEKKTTVPPLRGCYVSGEDLKDWDDKNIKTDDIPSTLHIILDQILKNAVLRVKRQIDILAITDPYNEKRNKNNLKYVRFLENGKIKTE